MKDRYLEVTFRRGKPFAAYLYLARKPGDHSARVERREGGLLIDRTEDERAIGVEIPSPAMVTLPMLNQVLMELSEAPLDTVDIAPLGVVG